MAAAGPAPAALRAGVRGAAVSSPNAARSTPYPVRMRVRRVDVRRGIPPSPIVAVAVLAAVAGLAVALPGPIRLALHSCLPGEGPAGWLGLRLALLRSSVDCPDGTLALGGSTASSALVVASVALPTVLLHVLAAVCGVRLSALVARAASGLRRIFRAAWRVLPGSPRAPWVRACGVAARAPAVICRRVGDVVHPDRGPPALAAA